MQGRHVLGHQVLHLVDENGDTVAGVARKAGKVGEQFDQVNLDIAGVGASGDDRCVDARLPAVPQFRGPAAGAALLALRK